MGGFAEGEMDFASLLVNRFAAGRNSVLLLLLLCGMCVRVYSFCHECQRVSDGLSLCNVTMCVLYIYICMYVLMLAEKEIYSHITTATDAENIRVVFNAGTMWKEWWWMM